MVPFFPLQFKALMLGTHHKLKWKEGGPWHMVQPSNSVNNRYVCNPLEERRYSWTACLCINYTKHFQNGTYMTEPTQCPAGSNVTQRGISWRYSNAMKQLLWLNTKINLNNYYWPMSQLKAKYQSDKIVHSFFTLHFYCIRDSVKVIP